MEDIKLTIEHLKNKEIEAASSSICRFANRYGISKKEFCEWADGLNSSDKKIIKNFEYAFVYALGMLHQYKCLTDDRNSHTAAMAYNMMDEIPPSFGGLPLFEIQDSYYNKYMPIPVRNLEYNNNINLSAEELLAYMLVISGKMHRTVQTILFRLIAFHLSCNAKLNNTMIKKTGKTEWYNLFLI